MNGRGAMPAAMFEGVSVRYPGAVRAALEGVDWEVAEGEFVLVAGPSGSGKSTLLRCLNGLVPHFSGGRFGGAVTVHGLDTRHYATRALSREVGFVFQDPEAQLVTNRVADEIAFGMEQLGVPPTTMRKRVEEMLDLLGIAPLRERDPATLSGGERQRVAVAAALALQPRLLALDEPTSQLDPWGAEDVLTALTRLNEDLGLTVVLAEHRLERVIGHTDRLTVLDAIRPALDGPTREVLAEVDPGLTPPIVRLGRALGWAPLPLTIKEGRSAVAHDERQPRSPVSGPVPSGGAPVLSVERLTTGYERRLVLREVDLAVRPGEIVAVMGRNGSGKTTLLRSIIGFQRASSGRIIVAGRDVTKTEPGALAGEVAFLPQRPSALLFQNSVCEEIGYTLKRRRAPSLSVEALLTELDLRHLADAHPRDLSVGEQERVALAAVVVGAPRLLLLDEPTRGLDALRKRALSGLLTRLAHDGTAIVMATHDVELVAGLASRVVLLGDGAVVADGTPREVLSGSLTFATQINKLYGDGFLTVEDVVAGLESEELARHGTVPPSRNPGLTPL